MDPDETTRMRRLIWIHAGHKHRKHIVPWRDSIALSRRRVEEGGGFLAHVQQTTPNSCDFADDSHLFLQPRYTCSVCGKDFLFQSYLNRHMVIHTRDKPYKCDYCDARFTQMGSKNSHMKRTHDVVTLD